MVIYDNTPFAGALRELAEMAAVHLDAASGQDHKDQEGFELHLAWQCSILDADFLPEAPLAHDPRGGAPTRLRYLAPLDRAQPDVETHSRGWLLTSDERSSVGETGKDVVVHCNEGKHRAPLAGALRYTAAPTEPVEAGCWARLLAWWRTPPVLRQAAPRARLPPLSEYFNVMTGAFEPAGGAPTPAP